MLHKDFPRILVGQCPKCQGALREQMDPGEWICVNCGMLVLDKPIDFSHLDQKATKYNPERRIKPPTLPSFDGIDEEEDVHSARSILLEETEEEVEEGDDQEWDNLVNFHTKKMTEDK